MSQGLLQAVFSSSEQGSHKAGVSLIRLWARKGQEGICSTRPGVSRATATGPAFTEAQGEQLSTSILCLLMLQKEHQILREADFKKWLHRKLLLQDQSLIPSVQRELRALPRATALSKTCKDGVLWPPTTFHPSPEARLQQIQQPNLPLLMPAPTYKPPTIRRPKVWNLSSNPARSPTAQIAYPQGVRLGVHPDPRPERDFRCFVEVRSDGHGGAHLRTVAGRHVEPVPRLPFEVVIRELYPSMRPYRMKVPQGFCSVTMGEVPRKRHLGDSSFWTDTLSMNLRETFDEAFLAAVRAHQGLPALPSPKSPLP